MIAANGVTPIPVAIHTPTSYLQISYIRKIDFLCKRIVIAVVIAQSPLQVFLFSTAGKRGEETEERRQNVGGGEGIEGGKSRAGRAVLNIFG